MRSSIAIKMSFLLAALLVGACTKVPMGPRVRVATATAAELRAMEKEDSVWYEFQPGDVIPVQFGFLGSVDGGSDGASVLRAKQQFFFVTSKNGPIRLSFDGKTLAGDKANQSIIAVVPREDGQGGQLVWVVYMGQSGNPEAELEKLIEKPVATSDAR